MVSSPSIDPQATYRPFKYICLAGPTASGKSAASLLIAQHHKLEIISVDSALVFRGMDIGTAKPAPQELANVPHHLINIIEPTHSYSAAQFAVDTRRLVGEIHARGALPLLVGGTMLYFKALLQGLDAMPSANLAVREEINREAVAAGWPAMHSQLAQVDPTTAVRLNPNDAQRIQRALEVYRSSGQALSSFHHRKSPKALTDIATAAPDLIANSLLISLEPENRAWLHDRIAQRMQQMLQQGLVNEVRQLRERGDLSAEMTSMRCVGYRQTWEMLDGAFSESELLDRCIFATRQLAKRQITWLRSMPQRHVVHCDQPQAARQVLDKINRWL